MTLKTILINVLIIGTICTGGFFVYHKCFKPKTAYVEVKKVFNGFVMKKELEEKFKQTAGAREKIIDSLSLNLKLMSKQLNELRGTKAGVSNDQAYQFEFKKEEF